jgi:hypothetical protein
MKLALLAPKYFVVWGKMHHAVKALGPGSVPSAACGSRQ